MGGQHARFTGESRVHGGILLVSLCDLRALTSLLWARFSKAGLEDWGTFSNFKNPRTLFPMSSSLVPRLPWKQCPLPAAYPCCPSQPTKHRQVLWSSDTSFLIHTRGEDTSSHKGTCKEDPLTPAPTASPAPRPLLSLPTLPLHPSQLPLMSTSPPHPGPCTLPPPPDDHPNSSHSSSTPPPALT